MRLVDTHCHLDTRWFDDDRDQVVARAGAAGVVCMIVASNMKTLPRVLALAEQYEGIYATVGVYPRYCANWQASDAERLRALARQKRVVAIGEIGLLYAWNNRCSHETQQHVFAAQMELAADLDLPVVVHNQFGSYPDCLELIAASPLAGRDRAGMLHGFNGDYDTARRALDLGLYLSLAGPITYQNAKKLPALVARLPLDRIVVETDAPCLPPHPHRGERNEPAYVRLMAERIAAVHQKSLEEIARITTENARRLFRLDDV